jgi:dTDP-4-amino-4,6-dideoxygalactose transaminase
MKKLIRQLNFAQPALDDATIASVVNVLKSNWLTSGKKVLEFEEALSQTFNGRPTRVVTSATAALEIAMDICNIGVGDEVILSAQSFFSTLNMVVKRGAKPVFVDCELKSRAVDLNQVEKSITPRTKAIIPTHFPGAIGDMDAMLALAKSNGLRLIEDAALTQGSYWRDKPVGSFGDITTFSFHPNKNMTTIEGGAIVVNTQAEAKQAEVLRFHGIIPLPDGTRDVIVSGGKFNLSDVSAMIGLHQLDHLPKFLEKRASLAQRYFAKFPIIQDIVLPPRDMPRQSWNMFCVLFPFEKLGRSRIEFRNLLRSRGINTGISYEALHLTTLARKFGYGNGQFPNAERISLETVTLPLHAAMELQDVDYVCEAIDAIFY